MCLINHQATDVWKSGGEITDFFYPGPLVVSFTVGYLTQEEGKCSRAGLGRCKSSDGEKILYPAEARTACHLSVAHSVANLLY